MQGTITGTVKAIKYLPKIETKNSLLLLQF